jgi:4-hydroxybenzoate polyprenyltransferase
MKFLNLIHISRPRFWLYLAGPFLIGIANTPNPSLFILFGLAYFLFPANLFLYGINDLSDYDTDAINPKKMTKEKRLHKNDSAFLNFTVIFSVLVALPLFFYSNALARISLVLFFILGYAYSAAPIRLKSRPFVDSASNVLYILPGVFSYSYITGILPSISLIMAGWCWAAAMHLFSAIPDIAADAKVRLNTTAVVLGVKNSLLLCSLLWFMSAFLVSLHHPIGLFGLLFGAIPLWLLKKPKNAVALFYWKFPTINGIVGFLIFLAIYLNNLVR